MQPISGQQISKHVPAATNMHATLELLLEMVFSARFVQSGYKEEKFQLKVSL
jgi:hypothetical protein